MDSHAVASEARLQRASFHGCILLVEGTGDALFYGKFVSKSECVILTAFSRENVESALQLLETRGIPGVLGLIDRDYENQNYLIGTTSNIVCTEENDLEMMIICSPALEAILDEFGSSKKIDKVEAQTGKTVRELILESSSRIGALRVLSKEKKWNLKFEEMKFRYTNNNGIEIDIDRQYKHVVDRSEQVPGLELSEVKEGTQRIISETTESKDLCCGHDVVRILARGLRILLGSSSQFDSIERVKNLEKILRLAYERAYFENTRTYADIRNWEDRNGYQVF